MTLFPAILLPPTVEDLTIRRCWKSVAEWRTENTKKREGRDHSERIGTYFVLQDLREKYARGREIYKARKASEEGTVR